jgi:hypothetical protein
LDVGSGELSCDTSVVCGLLLFRPSIATSLGAAAAATLRQAFPNSTTTRASARSRRPSASAPRLARPERRQRLAGHSASRRRSIPHAMPFCASSHGNRPLVGCAARRNRQRRDGSSRIRHRVSVRARDGFIAFPLPEPRLKPTCSHRALIPRRRPPRHSARRSRSRCCFGRIRLSSRREAIHSFLSRHLRPSGTPPKGQSFAGLPQ